MSSNILTPQREYGDRAEVQSHGVTDTLKRTPFVGIGMAATAGVLGYGMFSMMSGNKQQSARGMAFRVYGQAATVAMLLGYATYAGHGPFAIVNNKIRTLFGYPPLEIHNSGIIKSND